MVVEKTDKTPTVDITRIPEFMKEIQERHGQPSFVKQIIAGNPEAFKTQSRVDYHCLAIGLPWTTRAQMYVNQNPYLAPLDAGLTVAAKVSGALLIVQGAMWLYRFARGGV